MDSCWMRDHHSSVAQGFSLVELSIVLVIIGLLVGGILAGKSVLRAAEIRSIVTEAERIKAAARIFKDKYMALPGDMYNATNFWGAAHATPATCKETASTGSATCNGDGNGEIEETAGSYEFYRFWQHLANSGLYEGTYTGVPGPTGTWDYMPGKNAPRTQIPGTSYAIVQESRKSGDAWYYDGDYSTTIYFGKLHADHWPDGAILTPEEMLSFDDKYDDGKPATGTIRVYKPHGLPDCADSDQPTAQYKTTVDGKTCHVIFLDQF